MNAAAPTVNAGSRMCQPITQANCNRDRKTGSKSISVTPGGHCNARKQDAHGNRSNFMTFRTRKGNQNEKKVALTREIEPLFQP